MVIGQQAAEKAAFYCHFCKLPSSSPFSFSPSSSISPSPRLCSWHCLKCRAPRRRVLLRFWLRLSSFQRPPTPALRPSSVILSSFQRSAVRAVRPSLFLSFFLFRSSALPLLPAPAICSAGRAPGRWCWLASAPGFQRPGRSRLGILHKTVCPILYGLLMSDCTKTRLILGVSLCGFQDIILLIPIDKKKALVYNHNQKGAKKTISAAASPARGRWTRTRGRLQDRN